MNQFLSGIKSDRVENCLVMPNFPFKKNNKSLEEVLEANIYKF